MIKAKNKSPKGDRYHPLAHPKFFVLPLIKKTEKGAHQCRISK
jgi:hypothetical protein